MIADTGTDTRRRIYGRRRGRKLRAGRRALMDTLLPRVRIVLPPTGTVDPRALVPDATDVWLEIGFGAGEHLAAQARAHPDVALLGAEVFENGIAKLLAAIDRDRLANVRLFVDDARLLLACLPDRCLGRAFILFPDPWPKERHKKRRIVAAETLDQLARILRPGAELRLATDDADYADWIAAALAAYPAFIALSRAEGAWPDRPADWPATRYEEKAVAAGRTPRFFRLARRR
ncbi:MAG: tRNA (guanosine(46)-N7)-methyltransferase TrmB [Alphaproteobacteria bacterium]|nr:tRNA (guanosine(46)-N7)-methyltransferase TrmB [Alphaproteobacteria bacterium]MDE1969255.1 tRNA (guanosine(46)-N7)-methyltransferase TrmB [Alphaproteobacteria bacterium]